MKFKQTGEDGYVWYKLKQGNLYGARDAEGNNIIPIKYTDINYCCDKDRGKHWFLIKKGPYSGAYTREGRMVISVDRHYSDIDLNVANGKICWKARKNGKAIILDAKGKEIIALNYDAIYMRNAFSGSLGGSSNVYYFGINKNGKNGICDLKGRIICAPEYDEAYLGNNGKTLVKNINGEFYYDEINYMGGTPYFDCQPYDNLYYKDHSTSSFVNSSNSSSSSSGSSSNNNTGGGTTKVIVEQHGSYQVWVPCGGCQLEPGRCTYCHGSGWGYNNRLCTRCGGNGKCTICGGTGGHNEVQYR
jgi:hypothetical protein